MNLIPLADRVIVEPIDDAPAASPGGIIIPDTARKRPHKGRVVAIGVGRVHEVTGELIPIAVKPGDVVFYGQFAGSEVPGGTQLVMNETDLIAKVKE